MTIISFFHFIFFESPVTWKFQLCWCNEAYNREAVIVVVTDMTQIHNLNGYLQYIVISIILHDSYIFLSFHPVAADHNILSVLLDVLFVLFQTRQLTWILFFFFYFLHQSVNQGGDQELENLVTKLAILKDLLSSIEKKVHT